MKTNILLSIILLTATVNLSAQEAPASGPAAPEVFEAAGPVDAKTFVPAAMMAGNLHSVGEQASNDGLQNSYQLTSGGQTITVTGTPLLIQRINEIYALDYLRGLSKTQEFTDALTKSLGDKVNSVVGMVQDPVGTMKSLPKGASRFFGGIGEALKGGKSKTEGSMLDKFAGTEKAKAGLALKLGISPYTDNRELQDELTNTARVVAGGGLVVSAASMAATGGAGAALSVIGMNQTLQNALVNTSASDQRVINRKRLFALGLDRTDADAFLMHPNYTPWQDTIIVDALARIEANPKAFLQAACAASSPEDAFYFQRLAQLLLKYHATSTPIQSIRIENGIVCALDKHATLIIPVALDYAIWNEHLSARADQFSALLAGSEKIKAIVIWTDGQLSPRLCDELKKRNVSWKMLALGDNNNAEKTQ